MPARGSAPDVRAADRTASPMRSWVGDASPARVAFAVATGLIAALAFSARLAIMLRGAGLRGFGAYDDGVYFTAADALVHGRLPYEDFLLIQPPGVVLATAPFAALGTVVGDPTAFAAARVFFMLVGALNAVLVLANLRRFGRAAAITGGLFYAVFFPAVYGERSVLLEPLATTGLLLALLLLPRAGRVPRAAWFAGLAAGLTLGFKIWYVVPVAVLLVAARGVRARFALGALAGACLVYLPFFVVAPVAATREIVFAQLGRPVQLDLGARITSILGAERPILVGSGPATTIVAVLVIAALVTCALTPGARVFAALFCSGLAVLLASPSYFTHYAMLTAFPLALVIGAATGRLVRFVRPRSARLAVVAGVIGLVVALNVVSDTTIAVGSSLPTDFAAAMESTPGCVLSDDPTVLVVSNTLSRDLSQPDCTVWPDVTGRTYVVDRVRKDGVEVPRPKNRRWQHDVRRYLRSGDAVVLVRAGTGLSAKSHRAIRTGGSVLFREGSYVLWSTQ